MKILIIEDNKSLRENLKVLLKREKFIVETAIDWNDWLNKSTWKEMDLIILDINMPWMNGKEFLKNYSWDSHIIALTANSLLEEKLEMFELWVCDYITKPFEIKELIARIKTIHLKSAKKENQKINIWDIEINLDKKTIKLWQNIINLSHKQYLIVEFLARNRWYTKNKTEIMEYVWWDNQDSLELKSTTLESHIYAIRKSLWKNFIETEKLLWYIIK